jgi:hypothetical protein
MSKLTKLEGNKTLVFYSPVEGKDVLVRTGVSNSPYCLLHSCLLSSSKEYTKMSKEDKEKLVKKLAKNIEKKISEKKLDEKLSETIFKEDFFKEYLKLASGFYNFVNGEGKVGRAFKKLADERDNYAIIFEILNLNCFKECLEKVFEKQYNSIEEIRESISKNMESCMEASLQKLGKIDKKRRDFCADKFKLFINTVSEVWEHDIRKSFRKNIKGSMSLDKYCLSLVSDRLNRDIYIINNESRLPIDIAGKENIKDRKSIVLMWFGDLHFETVGKLLTEQRIRREFDPNDRLIRKMYSFLYNKSIIPSEYPSLIPYLEKTHTDKKSKQSSSSESSSSESESSVEKKRDRKSDTSSSRSSSEKSSEESSHTSRSQSDSESGSAKSV